MTNTKNKALPNGGTLEYLFGGTCAKIIDFLAVHREWDYSKQDIAKYSGVSIRHTLIAIEKLEYINLIKRTRNVGHAHMYQYNTQNPEAQLLQKFSLQIALNKTEKETAQNQPENNKIDITTTKAARKQTNQLIAT